MAVKITDIRFQAVKKPLNQPFVTVLQKVVEREATVAIVQDEDGRDGGNPEFDGEVTDQYTAEVTFDELIMTA